MKIKNKLRTAAELTISATMIATLLAACGGGGGGGGAAASAPTSTFNVTPGKGKMVGATVTIKNAKGNILGTASTTAAGMAGVAIPTSETGPFIIEVSCLSAACSYYDEKTTLNVSGSATMPVLQAVVPGATNTNLGVTAATTAAAQYALNTGAALTPTSIAAANTTVATSLGLPAGTNILTPPTIISDAATYAAAKAGTGAANLLANLSASFAMSASGVSAMQAIADYGNAWKQAALVPASGVIMPATIDMAALTLATSGVGGMTGIPTATIPNVAAAMTAATTAVTAKMTAVNNMYTTGSSASGLRNWFPTGAVSGVAADIVTLAPGATANNYTFSNVTKELVNGAWSVPPAGKYSDYKLTSTGWVLGNGGGSAGTVVNNNDGTLTITEAIKGTFTVTVQENVLDGTPILGSLATANYPAGSRSYVGLGGVTSIDSYALWNNNGANSSVSNHIFGVTDLNGTTLTALPILGTDSFCANGFVFTPIAGAGTGADNYEVFGTYGGCTASNITTGLLSPAMGTAKLSTKSTGNTVAPSVRIATVSAAAIAAANLVSSSIGTSLAKVNNCIIGVAGGVAEVGCPGNNNGNSGFVPAGTSIPMAINSSNKIAVDAELIANGYIALP